MFWKKKEQHSEDYALLSQLLTEAQSRESILGVQKVSTPTPEQLLQESRRIVSYARTEDYKAFAQRGWIEVLACLDKVLNPATPKDQVDFYRGAVAASLKMLRMAYVAQVEEKRLQSQTSQVKPGLVR